MISRSQQSAYPPFELANRVSSLPEDHQTAIDHYEWFGALTSQQLLDLLPGDYSLAGKHWLDFGCGAGRTLRHFLNEAEQAEIWGTDIDDRSIEWLQQNLCPPLHAEVCGVEPPLPFESESFDFIWAISVFTHLTANSAAWLLELHRILKPDGILIASFMGELNSETIAGEPWVEDRIGMNVLSHNQPWEHGGPSVFMSDWWVREHWGRAFEVGRIVPGTQNQTWAVLRKKRVTLTEEELLAPADDPREWQALKHNLVQVQREVERAGTEEPPSGVAEAVARTRADFESSSSWRITAPLRAAQKRLRKSQSG